MFVPPRNCTSRGRLVADSLTGAWRHSPPAPELSAEELELVTPLLISAGAAAVAWWKLRQSNLRTSAAAIKLQQEYKLSTLEAAVHEKDIEQVFTLLRAEGVEPILIKGWAIARLYPTPGLRHYSDIDLCVHPDKIPLAESILSRPENNKYFVDLIHDEVDRYYITPWDELFAHSQLVRLGEIDVRVVGAEDHLRLLCIHLLKHGVSSARWLCDIGLAVENRPADFDWQRCLGERRQADWVACAIGLAHQLLGASVKNTPVADRAMRLPKWLIPQVLKRWESTDARYLTPYKYHAPMQNYLRRPVVALKALRHRWPDPIEATIWLRGSFDELPRLPFQLGVCFSRIAKFIANLPVAGRGPLA